jgi:tetratricopeptide (TPR) repeat protein
LGSPDESRKSIDLFNQAIATADKLATSRVVADRRAAKELLVDCHLAIARQIARGDWQKKSTVVPQWLGRASAFAEEAIENDGGSLELRLRVAENALAALSSFQPMPDPSGWVREAQSTADTLLETSNDLLWRQRIHWQLGLAYFHALHIAHVRGDDERAIKLGRLAVTHLGKGARSREALPANEHLVGRLYFRIGAIYAIHREDHENAVAWYEKAAPLLKRPVPVSPFADPRRHGDALVSMGVSFWHVGKRERGLEFTELGTDLLTQAAKTGLVGSTALTVAYGNMATMHQALGNELEALQYDALARGEVKGDRDGTLRR